MSKVSLTFNVEISKLHLLKGLPGIHVANADITDDITSVDFANDLSVRYMAFSDSEITITVSGDHTSTGIGIALRYLTCKHVEDTHVCLSPRAIPYQRRDVVASRTLVWCVENEIRYLTYKLWVAQFDENKSKYTNVMVKLKQIYPGVIRTSKDRKGYIVDLSKAKTFMDTAMKTIHDGIMLSVVKSTPPSNKRLKDNETFVDVAKDTLSWIKDNGIEEFNYGIWSKVFDYDKYTYGKTMFNFVNMYPGVANSRHRVGGYVIDANLLNTCERDYDKAVELKIMQNNVYSLSDRKYYNVVIEFFKWVRLHGITKFNRSKFLEVTKIADGGYNNTLKLINQMCPGILSIGGAGNTIHRVIDHSVLDKYDDNLELKGE